VEEQRSFAMFLIQAGGVAFGSPPTDCVWDKIEAAIKDAKGL